MQLLKSNGMFKLALCVLALFCVIMIVTLQLQFNRLKQQKAALSEELAAAEERIDQIQTALNTPFDDEYIIKIAREKLNLRLPEEVVFYNDTKD